ncbi:hypothetical protein [Actinacidiphila soli]|jgi:hypothetical protein|uniref:hypothetical protein n=1 Tax=Actinacidiphila soli TaxID=2487275 RepID=UPI000FCC4597|nr:hypothetical protein [Actinacidiphila soli]
MKRIDYIPALRRLAREQDRVVTMAQLAAIGVPQSFVRERIRPGGRWQRPLPRVVVLHPGVLSVAQRCRAALGFAGHPEAEAMVTGTAGLALHRIEAAPLPSGVPVVDVLVPDGRRIRTHTWVRVHHARRLPSAVTVDGVPVAPLVRAAADGVRESCDPEWAGDVLRELVAFAGVRPDVLAAELGDAALARKPAVGRLLAELDTGIRSAVGLARTLVIRTGLRQPLWRPQLRLDGSFLASPDAYWARDGVALDLGPAAGSGRGRLETLGLRVVRIAPTALARHPGEVAAAVRAALAAGPYGPLERITVLPGSPGG